MTDPDQESAHNGVRFLEISDVAAGFPHMKYKRIIVNRRRQLELVEDDLPSPRPEAICQCNGEQIGRPMKVPDKGTIGLQSEIGRFEFRRIRIKELP
jgi:hypothetical protein